MAKTTTTTSASDPAPVNQAIDLSIDQAPSHEPHMLSTPKVDEVIEAFKDPETIEKARTFIANLSEQLVTINMLSQFILIVGALFLGWMIRRALRPTLQTIIGTFNVPYAVKNALRNITKLTLHGSALLIIFVGTVGMVTLEPQWNTGLLTATMKLLSAWIFIRIIAQIIANQFLRNIIATMGWTVAALSIIGVLAPVVSLLDAIGMSFGEARISLLVVLKAGVILSLLLAFAGFVGKVTEQRLRANSSLTPSAQVLIGKLIRISLVGFALIFGVTLSGIDLSAFALFGGALALGIGFGLQKVISNLFSGILLLADHSIKPGDIIEMPGGVFGWIGQLNARYVSIVTRDNKEYLVPNEDFITMPVINWSYTNRLIRLETQFTVHYDSDPHFVKKLAQDVTATAPRVVAEPKPVCHLVDFGERGLNFVLRYWIEDPENGVVNTRGPVMLALWDAFKLHDIKIPYPHQEIEIMGSGSSLMQKA